MLEKVLVVWSPRDDICESRAELGILFVAGYLASLETETCIDAETLVVEVSGKV